MPFNPNGYTWSAQADVPGASAYKNIPNHIFRLGGLTFDPNPIRLKQVLANNVELDVIHDSALNSPPFPGGYYRSPWRGDQGIQRPISLQPDGYLYYSCKMSYEQLSTGNPLDVTYMRRAKLPAATNQCQHWVESSSSVFSSRTGKVYGFELNTLVQIDLPTRNTTTLLNGSGSFLCADRAGFLYWIVGYFTDTATIYRYDPQLGVLLNMGSYSTGNAAVVVTAFTVDGDGNFYLATISATPTILPFSSKILASDPSVTFQIIGAPGVLVVSLRLIEELQDVNPPGDGPYPILSVNENVVFRPSVPAANLPPPPPLPPGVRVMNPSRNKLRTLPTNTSAPADYGVALTPVGRFGGSPATWVNGPNNTDTVDFQNYVDADGSMAVVGYVGSDYLAVVCPTVDFSLPQVTEARKSGIVIAAPAYGGGGSFFAGFNSTPTWLININERFRIIHCVDLGPGVDPLSVNYSPLDGRFYFAWGGINYNARDTQIHLASCKATTLQYRTQQMPPDLFGRPTPREVVPPFYINGAPTIINNGFSFQGVHPWSDLAVHPITGEVWYLLASGGDNFVMRYNPTTNTHVQMGKFRCRTPLNPAVFKDFDYDVLGGIAIDPTGAVYLLATNIAMSTPTVGNPGAFALSPRESAIYYYDPDDKSINPTGVTIPEYCIRLKIDNLVTVGSSKIPKLRTYQVKDLRENYNPWGFGYQSPGGGHVDSIDIPITSDGIGPAVISLNQPTRRKRGRVLFQFRLIHPNSEPANLSASFSILPGTSKSFGFQPATLAPPNNQLTNLDTSPDGVDHKLVWDSIRDIGFATDNTTRFKVTPAQGQLQLTSPFILDNSLGAVPTNQFDEAITPLFDVTKVLPAVLELGVLVPVLVIKGTNFADFDLISVELRSQFDNIPTLVFGEGRFVVVDSQTINIEKLTIGVEGTFDVVLLNRNKEIVGKGTGLFKVI